MNIKKEISLVFNSNSDFFGVMASVLCMLHCLATPFLFAAHAVTSASCAEISPVWWTMMDYLFLVITFFATYYSAKSTTLKWMPVTLYIFWTVLALLIFNSTLHIISFPHAFIYIPGLSLSFLHLYNLRHCRCQKEDCCINSSTKSNYVNKKTI